MKIVDASHFAPGVKLERGESPNELVFKDAFTEDYIAARSLIAFTLNYIKNPEGQEDTDSFSFQTFDSEGFGIEKLDSGLSVSSKVGSLKNISFAPIES